jgi:hypothetical protein
MDESTLFIIFVVASVPLVIFVIVRLFGWLFRRSINTLIRKSASTSPSVASSMTAKGSSTRVSLTVRQLEQSELSEAESRTATLLSEAQATTRSTRLAYIAAAVGYIAVLTFALSVGMGEQFRSVPAYVKVILVYLNQWPPLFILVWFLGISMPKRLAVLVGYLLLGLLLLLGTLWVPIASSFSSAAQGIAILAQMFALAPMAGLLFLVAPPLRPWLMGIVAILLFVVISGGAFFVIGFDRAERMFGLDSLSKKLDAVFIAEAAIFCVIAIVLAAIVLRQRSRTLAVTVIVLAAATLLCALPLMPNHWKIGPFWVGPLLGVPINILHFLVLWSIFKLFVRLQEARLLPAQMLHAHLCWGFLTIFLLFPTFVLYQWWTPWVVLFGFALYLTVLHTLSHRIWAARAGCPGKQLLFLRVFGKADKREKLFFLLDDTWRRVGRIDLIAGADLATRTMGSLMLEAFLLRRTDAQFLKTDEDVDRRLKHLNSELEGDSRYPINAIYCYATAWQRVVAQLAPTSDAVLMDLRGFTTNNQGCTFELTSIIQQVPLGRIILLIDASSDYEALEEVAHTAWACLPSNSPNACQRAPTLRALNITSRPKDSRTLFALLLGASTGFFDETENRRALDPQQFSGSLSNGS